MGVGFYQAVDVPVAGTYLTLDADAQVRKEQVNGGMKKLFGNTH